jgi:hypothetical protein
MADEPSKPPTNDQREIQNAVRPALVKISDLAKEADAQLGLIITGQRTFWTFERAMEVLKVVGVLVAASWTYYLYVTGDAQRTALALQQARLDQVRTELETEQLKLQNAQSRQAQEITSSGAFSLSASLVQFDISKRWKEVDFRYTLQNSGSVPLKVGTVILEWYVGRLEPGDHGVPLVRLATPPVAPLDILAVSDKEKDKRPITWERVSYRACRNLETPLTAMADGYELSTGGCGTDTYRRGISAEYADAVLLGFSVEVVGASIVVVYGPEGNEHYIFKSLSQIVHPHGEDPRRGQ